MTQDELLALIVDRADRAKARSSSPSVDGWCDDIVAAVGELRGLPAPAEHADVAEQSGRLVDRLISLLIEEEVGIMSRLGITITRGQPEVRAVLSMRIGSVPIGAIEVGATHQLGPDPIYTSLGREYDYDAAWSSSAPGVATVSSAGLLTGVAVGTTTITGSADGKSASFVLTVVAAASGSVVSDVRITPTPVSVAVSATAQLTALTYDNSNAVMGGRTHTWGTSAAGVATVSGAGLVTGVGAGTATITATDQNGVTAGTAAVTVTAAQVPTTVDLTPTGPITLAVGAADVPVVARVLDAGGMVIPGLAPTISSLNTGFATIVANAIHAVAAGSTTIRAAYSGLSNADAVITVTAATAAGQLESPTGYRPKGFWTLEWQYRMDVMRQGGYWKPWYDEVISNGNLTGTIGERDADYGNWATMAYQLTGDLAFARKAIDRLIIGNTVKGLGPALGPLTYGVNQVRDRGLDHVFHMEMLKPAMTTQERQTCMTALTTIWIPTSLDWMRTGDSDVTTNGYFMLAMMDLTTGSTYLSGSTTSSSGPVPIGGLTATATDRTTIRNTIEDYIALAAGGSWIESTEYDPATVTYALAGANAIRITTGIDYFPTLTALTPEFGELLERSFAPGNVEITIFGDFQYAASAWVNRLGNFLPAMAMVSGLAPTSNGGRVAMKQLTEMTGTYGWTVADLKPYTRPLYFFDPATPITPVTHPFAKIGTGCGLIYAKSATAVFGAQVSIHRGLDHQTRQFGDFVLIVNGRRTILHPIGYGSSAGNLSAERADCANTLLLAGLSSMGTLRTDRSIVQSQIGADTLGITMRNVGSYYGTSSPPAFVNYWVRNLAYFEEQGRWIVVVRDHIDATDPRANLSAYRSAAPADQTLINNVAPYVVEWLLHTPVSPDISVSGKTSYTVSGGELVTVHHMLPGTITRRIFDETVLWAGQQTSNIVPAERRFQFRVVDATSTPPLPQEQTHLNVLIVGAAGLTPSTITGGIQVGQVQILLSDTSCTLTRI